MIRRLQAAHAEARLDDPALRLLDLRTDDPAARPYRAPGLVPLGEVPDCRRSPDGGLAAPSFYDLDLRAPAWGDQQEP
jgi:hypothetical protein